MRLNSTRFSASILNVMHFSGHNTDENIDLVQALKKCFLNGFHLDSFKVGFLHQDEDS